MTLPAGSRLGPYEILAPLGAGGMGEVYRARDSRLGREVALKVLPPELSENRDRLSRFEQEARSASALNHPNIVTVHDIGRSDSTSYIAMELVDGRTLRELSAAGALPVRRVLALAVQVAEGLAKAHAAGIVHRDLKPENVMVSKDGFVKILDFGLAKLVEPESGQVSVMPTLAQPETHPGVVMGTVGYMSPEQASGEPLDFRSDQFSFGSILYEIATGEKPFQRKTAAETMSAIIREDPEPIAKARPEVPPPLRWIVERCLAKDPDERYVSTRDLARELASIRDHVSEVTTGIEALAVGPARSKRRAALWLVAAAVLLAAVAGWLAASLRSSKKSAPSFRRLTFRSGGLRNARFTPDGQTIVYAATWASQRLGLYAARVESPESRPFDLDADILAVSPDGQMAVLGEYTGPYGTLLVVPLSGGAPRPVVEQVKYGSADWSPDGKDLAVVRRVEGRDRLEFPIGKVLYEEGALYAPRFSPSGDSIAFFRADTGSVMTMGKSGDRVKMISNGWFDVSGAPCWAPDGGEIWFTATKQSGKPSGLYAADLKGRLRLVAQMPGTLELDDIRRDGRVLLAHHTFINSLWGLAPGESQERELSWLDQTEPDDLSPDGKTLLFSETGEAGGPKASVYLRKTDGSPAVRLGEGRGLSLSADGKWVLAHDPAARERLMLIPTGAGQPRPITLSGFQEIGSVAFLPDGKRFIFSAREREKGWRVHVFDLATGRARPVAPEGVSLPSSATGPVSPDGRWFLGTRGAGNLSRYPVEGGDPKPVTGVTIPDRVIQWAADGRSLYVFPIGNAFLANISLVDSDSGRRTPWKEIKPPDPAMTLGFIRRRIVITPDGRSYAYVALRVHSQLYVVEGLK